MTQTEEEEEDKTLATKETEKKKETNDLMRSGINRNKIKYTKINAKSQDGPGE